MANNEKVTYNDLFDKDVLAGIEKLQGATNVLYDDFKKIALASKEYGISSKDFVKSNNEAAKVSAEASKMIRQQEADRKKLIAASEKEARAMEKLTVAYQLQVKQQQEEINKAKTLASVLATEQNSRQRSTAIISLLESKIKSLNLATVDGQKKLEVWNKTIDVHNNKLKTTGSNLDQQRRNIGNYTGQWNALGSSVAQLSRELPNFAMSARIGFMAISNNLPAFSDAIRDINAQNKILAAEGKATTSVWKQLGSSIFGWQTLLTIGITLMVAYGEAFVNWASKVVSSSNEAEEALKKFNKTQEDIAKNTQIIQSDTYKLIAENKKKRIELLRAEGKNEEADIIEKQEIEKIKIQAEARKKGFEDTKKADAEIANQLRTSGKFYTIELMTSYESEQKLLQAKIKKEAEIIKGANTDINIINARAKKDEVSDKTKQNDDSYLKYLEQQKAYEISASQLLKEHKNIVFSLEKEWDLRILEYKRSQGLINQTQFETELNNRLISIEEYKAEVGKLETNLTQFGGVANTTSINVQPTGKTKEFKTPTEKTDLKTQLLKELGLSDDQFSAIKSGYDQIYDIASEHQQRMVELAKEKTDKANKEVDNARDNLEKQKNLRDEGYNYDILQAQKDLELAKRSQKKAEEEQRKALKRQQTLQTIEQAGNLITASTQIYDNSGGVPYIYLPLLALMWGSFAASKIKANQMSKQYALGGEINVGGGTHAEGKDTYIGTHNGKASYAQKGEKLAIFNDKAVSHYGSDLSKLIKGVNNKSIKLAMSNGGNSIIQFSTHGMESRLDKIYKQNEEKIYIAGNKMIIKKGSVTKIKNIS